MPPPRLLSSFENYICSGARFGQRQRLLYRRTPQPQEVPGAFSWHLLGDAGRCDRICQVRDCCSPTVGFDHVVYVLSLVNHDDRRTPLSRKRFYGLIWVVLWWQSETETTEAVFSTSLMYVHSVEVRYKLSRTGHRISRASLAGVILRQPSNRKTGLSHQGVNCFPSDTVDAERGPTSVCPTCGSIHSAYYAPVCAVCFPHRAKLGREKANSAEFAQGLAPQDEVRKY